MLKYSGRSFDTFCCVEITIAPEVIAKFKELLVEEDNEDAVFRIRETKVGGG